MKKFRFALFALFVSLTGVAHAMEGVFDRTEEVDKYIGVMKTSTTGTLAVAAKEISVSGIADPRLAAALNERLLNDYRTISADRVDDTYGVWMARALASFGIADYASTLKTVAAGTKNQKTRAACKEALPTIGWNQAKNQVMASKRYYAEGDDPAISRLMNLLMSDDYSYKHYAAERMNWEKVLDPRLMAAIAPQIQQYVDRGDTHLTDQADDTIANFVKLLGYSKNVQYRPVLESVIAYKNASSGVKRHAKYALDKLF
jgi:hypothetical protein